MAGSLIESFRAPKHREPISRHSVSKIVWSSAEDGEKVAKIRQVTIKRFHGRVPLLGNPNPNA